MKRFLFALAIILVFTGTPVLRAAPAQASAASAPYVAGGFLFVPQPSGITDVYQWNGVVWVYVYSTVLP